MRNLKQVRGNNLGNFMYSYSSLIPDIQYVIYPKKLTVVLVITDRLCRRPGDQRSFHFCQLFNRKASHSQLKARRLTYFRHLMFIVVYSVYCTDKKPLQLLLQKNPSPHQQPHHPQFGTPHRVTRRSPFRPESGALLPTDLHLAIYPVPLIRSSPSGYHIEPIRQPSSSPRHHLSPNPTPLIRHEGTS